MLKLNKPTKVEPTKPTKVEPTKATKIAKVEEKSVKPEKTLAEIQREIYAKRFDQMEKKFAITSQEINVPNKLSSGLLIIDLVSGGGLAAGKCYGIAGPEKGSKTTSAYHYEGQAVRKEIPAIAHYDAEGAVSDPDYVRATTGYTTRELYFGTDKKVRLYQESGLEDFYDTSKMLMRSLPDKYYRSEEKQWFHVFDSDQAGRANMADFGYKSYNKKLYDETGRLFCETEQAGLQGLIVIDSYAALLIKKIDDGDDVKQLPAAAALAFSNNIKKVLGVLSRKAFSIYGINQLRTNPMAMFGSPFYEPCFVGGTTVLTSDGVDTLRDIVLKRKKVKVLSFDPETGITSWQNITDWKQNGYVPNTELLKITYQGFDKKGHNVSRSVTCTKDHKIWTENGWKKAKFLKSDDVIFTNFNNEHLNNDRRQVLIGSILGDGDIQVDGCKIKILYNHVRYQRPYMVWKGSYLNNDSIENTYITQNGSSVRSLKMRGKNSYYECLPIFDSVLAQHAQNVKYKKANLDLLNSEDATKSFKHLIDRMKLLSLAIWYMDDGHFSATDSNRCRIACSRLSDEVKNYLARKVEKLTGLELNAISISNTSGGCLEIGNKENINKFFDAIKPYMHSSMAYKVLDPTDIQTYQLSYAKPVSKIVKNKILHISKADEKSNKVAVFDLTVENNHTYFVGFGYHNRVSKNEDLYADGLAVSNCGDALKFASSVRNQTRPMSCPSDMFPGIDEKGQKVTSFGSEPSVYGKGSDKYHYVKMTNTKNRLGTPGLSSMMRVWFKDGLGVSHGYDIAYDTFQFLEKTGRINGSPKRKIKVIHPLFDKIPALTWEEFKLIILAHTDPVLMKRARTYFERLKVIPNIRPELFKEIRTKQAYKMLVEGVTKNTEDLEA